MNVIQRFMIKIDSYIFPIIDIMLNDASKALRFSELFFAWLQEKSSAALLLRSSFFILKNSIEK